MNSGIVGAYGEGGALEVEGDGLFLVTEIDGHYDRAVLRCNSCKHANSDIRRQANEEKR